MHSLRRQCMLVHRLGVASQPSGSTTTVVSSFLPSRRHMHQTSVQFARNHYDVLEITPKATQADVKTAYYKMSMIHHPDKNKGNAESVEKFRAITSAYEVLSNYRLRRLYDKGIVLDWTMIPVVILISMDMFQASLACPPSSKLQIDTTAPMRLPCTKRSPNPMMPRLNFTNGT